MEHGLLAGRIHLEHRSAATRWVARRIPASVGGAVQVALCVQHYTCFGISAPPPPSEAEEDGLVAGRIHFEHCSRAPTALGAVAAPLGSAIQVALRVQHYTCFGISAVRCPGEAMEDGLVAGGIHLEHSSHAGGAPAIGCAIQIALRVQRYTCFGICAVRFPGETIEDGLVAARIHLEHSSHAGGAPAIGCAIQIALRVQRHTAGICTIPPGPGEVIEDGLVAARIHLEHSSDAVSTSRRGSPIQVALRVQH